MRRCLPHGFGRRASSLFGLEMDFVWRQERVRRSGKTTILVGCREGISAAHFQEFAQYVGGLQQAGTIKSLEAVLLDPHGRIGKSRHRDGERRVADPPDPRRAASGRLGSDSWRHGRVGYGANGSVVAVDPCLIIDLIVCKQSAGRAGAEAGLRPIRSLRVVGRTLHTSPKGA